MLSRHVINVFLNTKFAYLRLEIFTVSDKGKIATDSVFPFTN